MTYQEKKKKAISIAVAYFVEQEKIAQRAKEVPNTAWVDMGKGIAMENRAVVQRKGRMLR